VSLDPLFEWAIANELTSQVTAPELCNALSVERLAYSTNLVPGMWKMVHAFRELGHLARIRKAEDFLRRKGI